MAALAAGATAMPLARRASAASRSLRVSTFGGTFEQNFNSYIYPEFEAATGIRIEPVSAADASSLLAQPSASRAVPPVADLLTMSQQDVLRGENAGLWRAFDTGRIANFDHLDPRFVHAGSNGVDAIGGMAWYQTLVVNPKLVSPAPSSWKALWESGYRDAWGLASGSRSTLFEITAATWFGGNAILDSDDGIQQVIAKIDEMKPNVKLWWNSEGSMQSAYENGDIVGGMYFNDVANQMAGSGTAITSIFPEEGGVIDFGSWCQPAGSTKIEEAQEFLGFMSAPATQALLTRKMGTAPLVDRALMDLTDVEFGAVSSARKPIAIAVQARMRSLDFMNRAFAKMLVS